MKRALQVKSDGFNMVNVDPNEYSSYPRHNHSTNGNFRLWFIQLHNNLKYNVLGSKLVRGRIHGDILFVKTHYNDTVDISYGDLINEINAIKRLNEPIDDMLVSEMKGISLSQQPDKKEHMEYEQEDYYERLDDHYGPYKRMY